MFKAQETQRFVRLLPLMSLRLRGVHHRAGSACTPRQTPSVVNADRRLGQQVTATGSLLFIPGSTITITASNGYFTAASAGASHRRGNHDLDLHGVRQLAS